MKNVLRFGFLGLLIASVIVGIGAANKWTAKVAGDPLRR